MNTTSIYFLSLGYHSGSNNEKNAAEELGHEFVLAIVENVFKNPTIQYLSNPIVSLGGQSNPSPHSWNFNLWKED